MSYTVCRSRSVLLRLITCRDQNELGCRAVSFLQRTFTSSSSDGSHGDNRGSHGDDHKVSDDQFDLHPSRQAANRITAPTMPKKMLTDYNAASRRKVYRHVENGDPYMSSRRDFESYSNDTGYDLLELERKDPWKREKRIRSDRRTFRRWGESEEYRQAGYRQDSQVRNNRDGTGRTPRTGSHGVTSDNGDSPSVIRELLESTGRLEPRSVPQENERRENGNWYNYGLAGPGKKQRTM